MRIEKTGTSVRTIGLNEWHLYDLNVDAKDPSLLDAATTLIESLVEYQRSTGEPIKPSQTIDWGTGQLICTLDQDPAYLAIHERLFRPGKPEYVPGALNVLRMWHDQHAECQSRNSPWTGTPAGSFAVVSPSVLSGDSLVQQIEGVRYPFAADNSGWWFLSPDFDGRVDQMKRVHIAHLVPTLGSIARFLGLAPGYAFRSSAGAVEVWYEADTAAREPV